MSDPVLTERDLEYIFAGKKKSKTKSPWFQGALFLGSFLVISGIVFVIMNFTTLHQNFSFWYNNEYKIGPVNTEIAKLNAVGPQTTAASLPEIENNSLYLPIIDIKAPISFGIPNKPENVAIGLSKGLIQIQGTALPGEVGNVFVTGHSSNYPWAKGNYNNVFALLNKVVVGDVIQIKYQNTDYIYKVSSIKVVEPTDVSVMESKKESILTLMTCTPVGTSIRRLIVVADQVYPNPAENKTMQERSVGNSLPPVH